MTPFSDLATPKNPLQKPQQHPQTFPRLLNLPHHISINLDTPPSVTTLTPHAPILQFSKRQPLPQTQPLPLPLPRGHQKHHTPNHLHPNYSNQPPHHPYPTPALSFFTHEDPFRQNISLVALFVSLA